MSDNTNLRVSRRKVLAGLGTIGIASAGAGLGTTAFFSDDETVKAALEAGRLDLLMDFRAEYYPWETLYADVYPRAPDERFDTDGDGDVDDDDEFGPVYVMGQSPDLRYAAREGEMAGEVLSGEDWGTATLQVRACEDPFDNGVVVVTRDDGSEFAVAVDGGTGFGNNLPADGSDAAPYFYESYIDGQEGIMFNLDDVKPKDAGEATLSLHLCDNDAYLWAQPFITVNDDNGIVEPEDSVDGTLDGSDGTDDGDLADYLWLNLFYDTNCNNQKDGAVAEGGADVMVVLDRSGSMDTDTDDDATSAKWNGAKDGAKLLVNALDANSSVGLVSYADTASLDAPLGTSPANIVSFIDNNLSTGGFTNITDAINTAQAELANNGTNSTQIMVLLTNGSPTTGSPQNPSSAATAAKNAGTQIYGIAYGSGANQAVIEEISSEPKVVDGVITAEDEFAYLSADIGDIEAVFSEIAQEIAGEICIYEGSLAGLAQDLSNFGLNAFPLDGAAERNCAINNPSEVQCFPGNETHCVAFEWYLPCELEELMDLGSCYTLQNGDGAMEVDGTTPAVGERAGSLFNELVDRGVLEADGADFDVNVFQTDRLEFGATFAAVQCRHNMSNVSPFGEPMEPTAGNAESV
jgi:predicted ribosomally synthesized peptide with SipW-like signal peptide